MTTGDSVGGRLVGMVIPDGTNQFFSTLAQAFQKKLNARRYALVVFYSDASVARELKHLDLLKELGVQGLVMISVGENQEAFRRLRDFAVPTLVLDREVPHEHADFLISDNELGSRLAVDHLHSLGHRRLGYLSGSLQTQPGRERRNGVLERMRELNRSTTNCLQIEGNFQIGSGVIAADQLLSMDRTKWPTAFMCGNDLMAIGLIGRLQSSGIHIPHDLSVVGYDDIPMASWIYPGLTTVRQDPNDIAAEGCALLLERIDAKLTGASSKLLKNRVKIIHPRLITRTSTDYLK